MATILNRIRAAMNAFKNATITWDDQSQLLEWLGIDSDMPRKAINEATYYTCLKMLSETMGKLPLKYYQRTGKGRIRAEPDRAAELLMVRPNSIMTPATFWGVIEYNTQHYGNGYVWMQSRFVKSGRYGGTYEITGFWPMQANCVEVMMDDAGVFGDKGQLYYRYSDPKSGQSYVFRQDAVLHFKTWDTRDGVTSKSVREILGDTIKGSNSAQEYMDRLYRDGMTASMALQYTGELDKARRLALQKEYNSLLSGARNAGKIVAVPVGMQLQPLNIKLADAQFAELKKYSALQIAAAFGIKPNQLNNYDKSSYANSEMQQLSFLVDTMLYRLTQYEQEINFKVLTPEQRRNGYFFKFNEKAILRTDSKTQMDVLQGGVNNAIYTPNEAREMLDLPQEEGGDVLMCNGNYIPITMVGQQYVKEGGVSDG